MMEREWREGGGEDAWKNREKGQSKREKLDGSTEEKGWKNGKGRGQKKRGAEMERDGELGEEKKRRWQRKAEGWKDGE